MKLRITAALLALAALAVATDAAADCAGGNVADVKKAYAEAQALDRAGQKTEALWKYYDAQEYVCGKNPVEQDAARRAAELALPLGQAAEKKGDFKAAFEIYEHGGYYAAADRALLANVRANQDEPHVVDLAITHFQDRQLEAFQANNALRISIAGAYSADPKQVAEVLAMPGRGAERALQREAADFNEQYLAETVKLVQSTPNDPTDMNAIQAFGQRQQAFAQNWPEDLLKKSRDELNLVRTWAGIERDQARARQLEERRVRRADQRTATLTQRYSGAPKLLEAAKDYQNLVSYDTETMNKRVNPIKAQAAQLGDAANAKGLLTLAADYYDVAEDKTKEQAARERQKQIAMQKMQPSIEQMQRQAEAMRAAYSDPAKVAAMKQQAEAAQRALQQNQADPQANAKKADELEDELGMH